MEKTLKKHSLFSLRLTPGEAIQLDAISRRLGIPKAQVLRLSLSSHSSANHEVLPSGKDKTTDAILLKTQSIEDRIGNLEALLGSAVDLLLSVSRNGMGLPQSDIKNEPQDAVRSGPKWSDFCKKNFKTNPLMSDSDWSDFLKKRYVEQHGHPPDLST